MKKRLFILVGWIFFGIGIIGAFLPLLPTVPFMILAAICFKHGSDRLHSWLLKQPGLGPAIEEWNTHGVIRPHAKLLSVGFMTLSMGYIVIFRELPLWVKLTAGLTYVLVSSFILTRKSESPKK